MKTFITDIIPKIQRFSQRLDNQTLLSNQHWVVFDDVNSAKNVYIFRSNNQLLISKNGIVEKCRWENISNKSLLIDLENESYLFKHGFFDQNILALKLDGKEEYAFLINENKYAGELNSYDKIIDFLVVNYVNKPLPDRLKDYSNEAVNVSKTIPGLTRIDTSNGVIYMKWSAGSELTGRKVYSNETGKLAPDGKYEVGFMWYIHVKNGIVTKGSLF